MKDFFIDKFEATRGLEIEVEATTFVRPLHLEIIEEVELELERTSTMRAWYLDDNECRCSLQILKELAVDYFFIPIDQEEVANDMLTNIKADKKSVTYPSHAKHAMPHHVKPRARRDITLIDGPNHQVLSCRRLRDLRGDFEPRLPRAEL